MSIRNNIFVKLLLEGLSVIFPPICPLCRTPLTKGQRYICTSCRLDIPLTGYWQMSDNPMAERVRNLRPEIEEASSLLFYIQNSTWRRLIHDMKYRDRWYHGRFLGEWLGRELASSDLYSDIEVVVAVPLHPLRLLRRGYNQSDYIAQGVAKKMGVKHIKGAIKRTRSNSSQTKKRHHERWDNVEGLFRVTDPKLFEDRSVLLVDDVFTTGATIMSCAEAILDAAPSCRLSIATIAVSYHEFNASK
ncbi:MAG: ComF family protein [Rikenellaceae bacterium]